MSNRSELTAVLDAISEALREAGIVYFVTGSFASSVHGEFRATNDVDIVADLNPNVLSPLLERLSSAFVVDIEQAVAALDHGTAFNLIHRETYLKVDFFPCATDFDREAARRAERLQLPGARETLRIATKEDILLAKLRWYRLGDEVSSTQRRDIDRLIALNRDDFDMNYLRSWADRLVVADLLNQFFT